MWCMNTYRYTHNMDYYSAIKKNEMLPSVAIRMDFEGIFLSEMSEKDKYYRISLYGESKTKQNKNKFIDTDIR